MVRARRAAVSPVVRMKVPRSQAGEGAAVVVSSLMARRRTRR